MVSEAEAVRSDPGIRWLLGTGDPSVEYLTRTELLDEGPDSPAVRSARERIPMGPKVRALLSGQDRGGGFGFPTYGKWRGAHWRLVSLVDLGVGPGQAEAVRATEPVLRWLTAKAHRRGVVKINGLIRRCASQEGNALGVCSRLGLVDDPRVQLLAGSLVDWQWPDGGWNCDRRPLAHHSSFYESLAPLWGLIEYHRATGDREALAAAHRTAEFFLHHHLFRSERTGKVADARWLQLHYPLYYYYDILQALRVLSPLGMVGDSRAAEALDLLEAKRHPDGTWWPEAYYWRPPGTGGSRQEVVDWGRHGPNEMLTLKALRVLKAAGRPPIHGVARRERIRP